MSGRIGYYVHHQGDGHRQRAAAIARAYGGQVTLIGTDVGRPCEEMDCIGLPDDRLAHGGFDGADGTMRPPSLHYAPLHHEGQRRRVAIIAAWIAAARPSLMIVDVSVEVAMLARLASVPFVYVRLNGRRDDRPHLDAFAAATGLLAPFAEPLDDPGTPDWVRARTFYAPGILVPDPARKVDHGRVLVVAGKGGAPADGERWAKVAAAVPDRRWRLIGPATLPARRPANLEICGWVDHADAEIAAAGVVIGAAGDGLVSAVLAHDRPFICFPEPRAFDEQAAKAQRLAACDAAVVPGEWPVPGDWPRLLLAAQRQAAARPDAMRVSDGANRVARWLEQLAGARVCVAEPAE